MIGTALGIPAVSLAVFGIWYAGQQSDQPELAEKSRQPAVAGDSGQEAGEPAPAQVTEDRIARLLDEHSQKVHEAALNEGEEPQLLDGEHPPGALSGEEAAAEIAAGREGPVDLLPFSGKPACSPVEYAGAGPDHTKLSRQDWARTLKVFYGAKGRLLKWLDLNRMNLGEDTADVLEAQLRKVAIEMPPPQAEPDLGWRGIATLGIEKGAGDPLVRMGSGFVTLIRKHPERARYELARVLAQAWAPCALQEQGEREAWTPLLGCMGIPNDESSCLIGSYSEAGWAVGSVLATWVEPADCVAPAFADLEADPARCLVRFPLPEGGAPSHVLARFGYGDEGDEGEGEGRQPASMDPDSNDEVMEW